MNEIITFQEFKKRIGRPEFPKTPEILDYVVQQTALGIPITKILAMPGLPCFNTWSKWLDQDDALMKAYARARKCAADMYVAKAQEVVEDASNDLIEVEKTDKNGNTYTVTIPNSVAVARAKLQADFYLKMAAIFNRNVFGESAGSGVGDDVIEVRSITTRIIRAEPLRIEHVEDAPEDD